MEDTKTTTQADNYKHQQQSSTGTNLYDLEQELDRRSTSNWWIYHAS
jgi:hypothetical protein